ncbi:hemagglutinin repeat-containing protein [Silvimonas sp. JCM 19000]
MNQRRYRLVFNRCRKSWMPVAEITHQQGQSSRTGTAATPSPCIVTLQPLRLAICAALGLVWWLSAPAQAEVRADKGAPVTQQATVLNAGNGVPLVNIQTPSAAGVSRNVYSQFDVDRNGVILNNARNNSQTQLGGWVQGNPWLAKGTARIILNEVNASDPSKLRGYVEVAGSRAQVIIANPAGIQCDGCGFINAHRVTLTTGNAVLNHGNLDGYRVQRGVIDISGAGMDSREADYTDLIARAVRVNAGLWASTLKVTAGANEVSADHSGTTGTAATGTAPVYGIDSAVLGGMYAGKITLVATEAGVGVRNLGAIGASAGDIVVTADGRLENGGTFNASGDIKLATQGGINHSGTLYARGHAQLETAGALANSGKVYAQGNAQLHTTAALSNSGSIAARGDATLQAGQIDSTAGSVLAAGLDSDGVMSDQGALQLSSHGKLSARGRNLAGARIALSGSALDLSQSQTAAPALALQARQGDLLATGATLAATSQLHASSSGLLRTDAATVHAPMLTLDAHDLSNVGGQLLQTGPADLVLRTPGNIDNSRGRIGSNSGNLNLQAATLGNQNGRIEHTGAGTLQISTRALNGHGGSILGAGLLQLQGGQFDLSAGQTGADRIRIDGASLNNASGRLVQGGAAALQVTLGGALDNHSGLLAGNGDLALQAARLDNRDGQITATGAARLATPGMLQNGRGLIAAHGALGLRAGQLDNQAGSIASVHAGIQLHSDGALDNGSGQINAAQDITLTAADLRNQQGRLVGRDLALRTATAGQLDNRAGTLGARGQLDLHSGAIDNTAGLIQAEQALGIDTHGQALTNQQAGSAGGIVSLAALTVQAGQFDNRAGRVSAGGSAALHAAALDNRSAGVIRADGALRLTADSVQNQTGQLQATGNVDLAAGNGRVDNTGGLINSGGTLHVVAAQVSNRDTATPDHGLQGQAVRIDADQIDNQAGALYAETLLDLTSHGTLDNQRGTVSGSEVRIQDRDLIQPRLLVSNEHGTIVAAQRISLAADRLEGTGRLTSHGDAALQLGGTLAQTGTLLAQGNLDLVVAGDLANRGQISAGEHLHVRAVNLDNAGSGELSGKRNTLDLQDALTNQGLLDGGATRVNASYINNLGTGRIFGDHIALGSARLLNVADHGSSAPVIAARDRLDLGVTALTNNAHALIFADGNMRIGAALDAEGRATGQADSIYNGSAQIQAMGDLDLSARSIVNDNLHLQLTSEVIDVSAHEEYKIRVDPRRYDVSEVIKKHDQVDIIHPVNCGDPCIYNSTGNYDDFIQYLFTRTVTVDRISSSDPAVISAGGNIRLDSASLQNNQSRLLAGNTLSGSLGSVYNNATVGHKTITDEGTEQHFFRRERRKDDDQMRDPVLHYAPPAIVSNTPLIAWQQQEHTAVAAAGHADAPRNPTLDVAVAPVSAVLPRNPASTPIPGPALAEVPGVAPGVPQRIRSVLPDTRVPDNALFKLNPAGPSGYLIETDPRFASYKTWLSSDYLLQQLQYDPTREQKRLGDGFYEQKLIREQVAQLTGRRFLDGYSNDQDQYQALLNNGATVARQWNLTPGVALTGAQMAQLTSDVVWLVSQTISLPDGSTTRALVPQVYVRVRKDDIDGNGALIGGNNVNLAVSADLRNGGTVAGRNVLTLTAQNVHNLNGRISADQVEVRAANDLNNVGGKIDAASQLVATAGRDLRVETTTRTHSNEQGSVTAVDGMAGLYVSNPGGVLVAHAGRDLTLLGGQIVNQGSGGRTQVSAEHDLNLNALTTGSSHDARYSANAWRNQSDTQALGATISTSGDLQLRAGNDLNASAAQVRSDKGRLQVEAAHDINLGTAQNTTQYDTGSQIESRMRFSRGTVNHYDALDQTTQTGSTFSGNTLFMRAGNDLNITGSNAVSRDGTVLRAGHDVKIVASIDRQSEQHDTRSKRSGLFSNGGLSLTYGKQQQSARSTTSSQTATAALVGATQGNVSIRAGNAYQQTGSDVLAPQGDIGIRARTAKISEARDASQADQQSVFKQSGLTVSINNPVLASLQTSQQMARAAGPRGDDRVQALAGAASALSAVNTYDAVKADPNNAGGFSASITYGQSKRESRTTQQGNTAAGSRLAAGGDVIIKATGAGADSNLTVQGSDIKGGGNVLLEADGKVNLLAAGNTNEQHSDSRSQSAGVGVALTYGKDGAAFGLTANAAVGKGGSDGTDQSWSNSHISAGKTAGIVSGGDTNIKGAVVSGRNVVGDIGGDLNVASLQDTHKYDSKDQQLGGSVTAGWGFSGSANASQQKINSDYASVTEQSGIRAGDGGFQVNVKGNTDLKGGVIESSQAAIDQGMNTFSTGTLTVSDIENRARYSATSVGIGGGYSQGGGGMKALSQEGGATSSSASGNGGIGKTQAGDVASAGDKVPGSGNKSGFSTGTPIAMAADGDSRSITRSGISAGAMTITDEAGQLAKTGKTAAETLASLDTTVTTDKDTTGALKPIFDKTQIEAGFAVTKELINQTGTYLDNRAKEAETKAAQAKSGIGADGKPLTDQQRQNLATEAETLRNEWGPGGTYRQITTALTVGAGGNVTGGVTGLVQGATVAYLQSLGASKVKEIADSLDNETARAGLHAIVACAGAAATSQACGAAALGAAGGSVINNLLDQSNNSTTLSPTEKDERAKEVGTLLAGISTLTGLNPTTTANAAQIETENNALTPKQILQKDKDLNAAVSPAERKKIRDKYDAIDKAQAKAMVDELRGGAAGVMTDMDAKSLASALQDLKTSSQCNDECRADADHGIQQIGMYLAAYNKQQDLNATKPLADALVSAVEQLVPGETLLKAVAGAAKGTIGIAGVLKNAVVEYKITGGLAGGEASALGTAVAKNGEKATATLAEKEAIATNYVHETVETSKPIAKTALPETPIFSSEPALLTPPANLGSIARNAMSDAEYIQAQEIVNFRGGHFEGAPTNNYAGIDGWLDGVPVQLKIVEGQGLNAIRRNITGGAADMAKQGYKGDLYIDASKTGASMESIINYTKPGTPVSNVLNEGTVNNVYIKTQDGWINITKSTLSKNPGVQ